MSKKEPLVVLIFVAYYLPGYKSGGPVRTIANMVEHLGDEFDFRIVALDRDALDTEPYPDVAVNEWNRVGNALVYYASPDSLTLAKIGRLIRETPHDVLYLNSFFSTRFTTLPLLAKRMGLLPDKPVVLAPRGEFSAGAVVLKSWKKRYYLLLSRMLGLYRGITWQASSEHEVADVKRNMGKKTAGSIIVAPNLPPPPDNKISRPKEQNFRKPGDPLRIVFLSRITPMKNLDFALKVLARVSVPVVFDIYGSVFDEIYWRQCRELIQVLPGNIRLTYNGPLPHEQVVEVLPQYDLFFLPTLGENFGHVIYEALTAGLPVLISDQTPWRNLGEKGIGWDLSMEEPEKFSGIIEKVYNVEDIKLIAMKKNAVSYALKFIEESGALGKNRKLFNSAYQSNHREG